MLTITIGPSHMNAAGVVYLWDPQDRSKRLNFVASRVKVKVVRAPRKFFFDFVGKISFRV